VGLTGGGNDHSGDGGDSKCVPRVHRYYLKNTQCTDQLIPDDMIGELLKESQITLLQLNAQEVAWQLTLEDFKVFKEIEPTEYIDDLFELDSKYGCPMLCKFAHVRFPLVFCR
jgi:Rap guanine nucleotide exchange factor 2